MDIERYSFEDEDGVEDTYTTYDLQEARDRARKYHMRLIAHIYEWTGSETIEDHTEH